MKLLFFELYIVKGEWYIKYVLFQFIVLLQHIMPWTQIWTQLQTFFVAFENLIFKAVNWAQILASEIGVGI